MLSPFLRKLAVTCGAALAFVLLYEVTILDSRYAARQELLREGTALPAPGARLRFSATAYCKGTTTAAGVKAQTGVAAADPDLLPVGSVVHLDAIEPRYSGVYTIMDTGPRVQGRHVDIYIWSCYEALDFGRQSVQLTVLRLGWNPRATTPGIDGVFRRREPPRAPAPPPSRPAAPDVPP